MGLLEKQIVKSNITNPIVTFKVSVELQNRIKLIFNPNATQLKNKLSVTLSAMTDVFEQFERMEDIMKRRLIEVLKKRIEEEEQLKLQKKRAQPKKKNAREINPEKLHVVLEWAQNMGNKKRPTIKNSIAADKEICKKS